METRIIVGFIVSLNVFPFIEANPLDRKITLNTTVDSYESQETIPIFHRKMAPMLSRNEIESLDVDSITREDSDPVEEGNKRIWNFGKRLIDSINRHGLRAKEARLLKIGKYRIDWWKKNRRLEQIRKRLAIAIERKPVLKNRLRSMGWRDGSATTDLHKNVYYDQTIARSKRTRWNTNFGNAMFFETLIKSLETVPNSLSTIESETGTKEQAMIFVYMPITIGSSTSEIDRIEKTTMTEAPDRNVLDSPTKFSLNKFNKEAFDALVSNVGVVDVTSSETSMSHSNDDSFTTSHSSGQAFDSDRLLQLIPLVVEELRNGFMPKDELREFGWIFGKRLWPLLEREASKTPDETMDQDLAIFFLTGKLEKRDSENKRRKRQHRRRQILLSPIANENTKMTKPDYDYDFNDDKIQDTSFVEFIEIAARRESKKFEEETKKRTEKKMHKKWSDDYYEDYSYEDDDTY